MEIELIVTVQVDSDDDRLTQDEAEATAKHAIDDALQNQDDNGFVHPYADIASVGYVGTVIGEAPAQDGGYRPNTKAGVLNDLHVALQEMENGMDVEDALSAVGWHGGIMEALGKIEEVRDLPE